MKWMSIEEKLDAILWNQKKLAANQDYFENLIEAIVTRMGSGDTGMVKPFETARNIAIEARRKALS